MTGSAVVIGGGCADITAICAAMQGAQILSVAHIGAFGGMTAARLGGLYDLLCSWGAETVYQKGGMNLSGRWKSVVAQFNRSTWLPEQTAQVSAYMVMHTAPPLVLNLLRESQKIYALKVVSNCRITQSSFTLVHPDSAVEERINISERTERR